jgi:cysteine sulfinate desulfinase/cysteine desulfurase-like protein
MHVKRARKQAAQCGCLREVELSPVLKAMGVPPQVGMGAIRFSLGRTTTSEEIDQVVAALLRALRRGL